MFTLWLLDLLLGLIPQHRATQPSQLICDQMKCLGGYSLASCPNTQAASYNLLTQIQRGWAGPHSGQCLLKAVAPHAEQTAMLMPITHHHAEILIK